MPNADNWLDANLTGFHALSLGRPQEAVEAWRAAVDEFSPGGPLDARLAAAKNNAGVGYLLLGHADHAMSELAGSLHLWTQVRDRLGVMDVPVAGRSSIFHLNLAIDHFEALRQAGRMRYVQWCAAAMEITRLNGLLAERRHIELRDCEASGEIITRAFGPQCAEIKVLRHFALGPSGESATEAASASSNPFELYGEKLSRMVAGYGSSQRMKPATEAEKLEVAAQLTALCDPRLCRPLGPDHQPGAEGK